MTISFREQAAIALHVADGGLSVHALTAVTCAQDLADAACKAWGHTLGNIDGLSDEQIVAKPCERCGKDIAT